MLLTKQYGKKGPVVNIDDTIEHADNSGANITSVMVLREDGKVDVYAVPDHPLKVSPDGELSTAAPGEAKITRKPGSDKDVKISSFMSMSGSPGCVCYNGTEYYW